jgi:hypothetical protein
MANTWRRFQLRDQPPYYGKLDEYLEELNRRKIHYEQNLQDYQIYNSLIDMIVTNYSKIMKIEDRQYDCGRFRESLYNRLFYLEERTKLKHSRRIPLTRDGRIMRREIDRLNSYHYVPPQLLLRLYKNQFFNPNVLKFIRCNLRLMFSNNNMNTLSSYWIANIRNIGDSSGYGQVRSATVGGYSDMVVFKTARTKNDLDMLRYENVVGHYINKLREAGNVNFTYSYGLIQCAYDKLCEPGQNVFMMEHINGLTYGKYIKKVQDPSLFMSSFSQLVLSLKWAREYMSLVHCDLHTSNVIARDGPPGWEEFYIPYPYQENGVEKTVYVKSRVISTIVDYGRTALIPDKSSKYGSNEWIHSMYTYFADPRQLSQLADIHKLLFMLYLYPEEVAKVDEAGYRRYDLRGNYIINYPDIDDETLDLIQYMLEFFIDVEDYELNGQHLRDDWIDSYGTLFVADNDPTFDEFIIYIKNHEVLGQYWNEVVVDRPPQDAKILRCTSCHDPQQLILDYSSPISGALDFLMRANEGWDVQISQRIVDELIYLIEQEHQGNMKGVIQLTGNIMKYIPEKFKSQIKSALRG